MITLDADVYDALVQTATEFGGVGALRAYYGEKPWCAFGALSHYTRTNPQHNDYRFGSILSRAYDAGLRPDKNDEVVRDWAIARYGEDIDITEVRMGIEEYLTAMEIRRRE